MIKREHYINQIRPFMNKKIIKVLTGLRRSGKSVMLKLIQDELALNGIEQKQFVSINFESMMHRSLKNANALYQELINQFSTISGKVVLFLDEIQEVTEWEVCVNSLLVDYDIDIYITGSNANLLSGELATYLAGRYVEIKIYPFSYIEFLVLCKMKDKKMSEQE